MSFSHMKENLVEQIKERIDILDIVKEHVPTLKRAGRLYKGCCPFHQERTPSFTVSPDKGLFYCFGCQTGGDLFAFLMKAENLSFTEAAQKLAERAGLKWERSENLSADDIKRQNARKCMDFAREFYHKTLLSSDGNAIREYLKSRNLTKETAQKFFIGATPSDFGGLCKAALRAGFNEETLRSLGLAGQSSGARDYFRSRLMFPIINHRGDTVGFGGRIVGPGEPKYLNSPETILFSKSKVLYGLNFAGPAVRRDGFVILLEGYMDVVACMQAGVENCVAPLGTAFAETHAKLLKKYADTAVILFDPDAAGIKASLRTALILIEQGIFVKVASLGVEGLDPDEYITKYGREAFDKVIQNATDIITFRADILAKNPMALTAQQKSAAAGELMEIIKKQPDPVIKAEWVKIAADRLNLDERILRAQLRTSAPPQAKVFEKAGVCIEEECLAAWLLRSPRVAPEINLTAEKFENKQYFQLFSAIKKEMEDNPVAEDMTEILQAKEPELKELIIKLSVQETPKDFKPERDIKEMAKKIEKKYLAKQVEQIQAKIKALGPGNVPAELLMLRAEIQKKLKSQ